MRMTFCLLFILLFSFSLNADLLKENLEKLKSDVAIEREKGVRALGSLQDKKAVPHLIELLKKEKEKRVKIAIIQSLGILKDKNASRILLEKLKDKDKEVRIEILKNLRKLEDKSVLQKLKNYFKKCKDLKEKCYIAGTLASLGNCEGLEFLLRILKEKKGPILEALENLGEFKTRKKIGEKIIPFLKDPRTEIRRTAAETLSNLEYKKAVYPIALALKEEKAFMNKIVFLRTLQRLKNKNVLDILFEVGEKEKNPILLKEIIITLGKIGSKRSVSFIEKFITYKNSKVQEACIVALGELEKNSGIPALIRIFKNEKFPNYLRGKAIDIARSKATGKLKEKAVYTLLKDKRWSVIWKDKEAPILIKFTEDKNEIVRARAYSGLARINIEKYWEVIKNALKDKSKIVRREIIIRIDDFQYKPGAELLKEIFPQEKEKEIKEDILHLFYDLGDKEGLRLGLNDKDLYIQIYASSGLALLGETIGFDIVIKGLESDDEEIQDIALETMENMKNKRAIPYLKKLLKRIKDKEKKKEIKKLIKKIKKSGK